MIINGDLKFHTLGAGELQNAIMERLSTEPAGSAGRLYYNSTNNTYWYHNGTNWVQFGTGGDVTNLQTEIDNIEAALGIMVNSNGTVNTGNLNSLTNVDSASTIYQALQDLDAAIEGKDALAELDDVDVASVVTGQFLRYDGTKWVDHTLVLANVSDVTTSVTDLNLHEGRIDELELDYADINTWLGRTDEQTQPVWTSVVGPVDATHDVVEAVSAIDAYVNTLNTNLTNKTIYGLADVADGSAYAAQLYGLVGNGTNSFTITGVNLDTLNDVVITFPAYGHIIYRNASAQWVNAIPATAGVQPLDAGLTSLAGLAATANMIIYATAEDTYAVAAPGATSGVQPYDLDLETFAGFDNGWDFTGAGENKFMFSSATPTTEGSRFVLGGGATARTAMGLGDIATLDQTKFIKTDGTSTITANITMSGYKITNLADPTQALDAVNKTYVDNLVTSGTKWKDPVKNPDLVGIAASVPATPLVSGMYIAYGGTTYPQTWGSITTVAEYDMMHYTATGWAKSGPLVAGTRLLAGVFTNALDPDAAEDLDTAGIVKDDLVEYVGGNPGLETSWTYPHGRVGGVTFPVATVTAATKKFVITGSDETASFHPGNTMTYAGGTASAGVYTISTVTFTGGNTEIVTSNAPAADSTGGTLEPEMEDGLTVLTSNILDSHNLQSYLYVAGENQWYQISGPGVVDAGIGLAYSGTTLNVQLGAGIVESPSDEVGIDLYDPDTGALILTTTGTSRVADSASSKLHLLTNTAQLNQDINGLYIVPGGITSSLISSGIAGDGITGGAGNPLSLDIVTNSGLVLIGTSPNKQLDLDAIPNSNLANSTITFGGTAGTPEAVALGETLTIGSGSGAVGGSLVQVTPGTKALTFDLRQASTSVTGVASFSSTYFTVTAGNVEIIPGSVGSFTTAADAGTATVVGASETLSVVGAAGVATGGSKYITTEVVATSGTVTTVEVELNNYRNTITGDTGSLTWDLGGTVDFAGTGGIAVAAAGNTVTIDLTATLNDLDNVDTTGQTANYVLYFNGTAWVPGNLGTLASSQITLNDLDDVDTTGEAAGEILVKSTSGDYKPAPIYHVHTQSGASATWTVTHNLGQKYCNVTIVDSADDVIIPQNIRFDTVNQLTVTLNTAITGTVVVMGLAIPA